MIQKEDIVIGSLKEISTRTLELIELCKQKPLDFNWTNFEARKIAVNCKRHNAQSFLRKCDERGYNFIQGESPSLESWFNRISYLYEEEVCFVFNDSKIGGERIGGLCHAEKDFFKEEGFQIIEYDDIPFVKELCDYKDSELIAELRRRHIKE